MEGAPIYQVANNCRTSVEMIEKFYAAHLNNRVDTAQINILKPKRTRAKPQPDPKRPTEEPGKPVRASRRRKRDV